MSCSFCASGRPTVLVFQIRSALELVDLKKPNLLLSWTCGDEECQLELMTTEAIDLRLWSDIRDFSSIYWGRLHRFMSVSRTLSLLFEGRTWTQSKVTSETMAPPANMVPKYENMIWFPSAHMSCIATEFLQSAACSQKRCLMRTWGWCLSCQTIFNSPSFSPHLQRTPAIRKSNGLQGS